MTAWKLVPVEPTQEMIEEYWRDDGSHPKAKKRFRAMLKAAPRVDEATVERIARAIAELALHHDWKQFLPEALAALAALTESSDE